MNKVSAIPAWMLGVVLLLLISAPFKILAHEQTNVIRFGVYPYESARSLYTLYATTAKRIEKKTGKRVELVSAPNQIAFIEKGKQGDYDLALVSPNCFYTIQPAGYRVIARGEPSFYGGTIVRGDSPITAPEQLRGKKIAALGKFSYGGYLYFRQELAEMGISPDRDVEFSFLDKVDSVILSVLNRKYDAGVIRLDTLENPAFIPVRDQLRIISRSREIPQFPFVVKTSMDQNTVDQIRSVLTAITPDNAEDKGILQSLQIERILAAQDADYEAFRQVLEKAKK